MKFKQKGYAVISKKDIDVKIEEICVFNICDKEEEKKIIVNDITINCTLCQGHFELV